MSAEYFVAQYVEDLFRGEPRNVGVVVQMGGHLAARFVGESEPGQIDGRKLKMFAHPDIYRQWVAYWRRMVAASDLTAILKSSRDHYLVSRGGEVTDTSGDSIYSILGYLYSTLVSDGGFQEAVAPLEPAAGDDTSTLMEDVKRSFQSLSLLETVGEPVAHPVRMNAPLKGKSLEHRPAFSQINGRIYAMETIDLTVARRRTAIDHAGLAAYMFRDLREAKAGCFSLVRVRDEDREFEQVKYALQMLGNESDVINWLDDDQRKAFVSERQAVAISQ